MTTFWKSRDCYDIITWWAGMESSDFLALIVHAYKPTPCYCMLPRVIFEMWPSLSFLVNKRHVSCLSGSSLQSGCVAWTERERSQIFQLLFHLLWILLYQCQLESPLRHFLLGFPLKLKSFPFPMLRCSCCKYERALKSVLQWELV